MAAVQNEKDLEKLLEKWEPKVNSLLKSIKLRGYEKEDIAQELRIAILKADNKFDVSRGVKFHTYLHVVMVNVLRGLISNSKKLLNDQSLESFTSALQEGKDYISTSPILALEDPSSKREAEELELKFLIESLNLSDSEANFIDLMHKGFKLKEISVEMGKSSTMIRKSIRRKIGEIHGAKSLLVV